MKISAGTDKGQIRKANEDSYFVSNAELTYFVVADGMGGHKGGRVASRMAIESINAFLCENGMKSHIDVPAHLREAVDAANSAIYRKAADDDSLAGMGTTVVLFYLCDDVAYIANVGDSRCYRIRNGKISQITKDHSIVWDLYEKGQISRSEMRTHPNKNIITRAVGTNYKVECDVFELPVSEGDGFILCSDGLSNMLDDEEILKIFIDASDTEACVDELIRKANEAGGTDNITVVAAKL